MNYEGIYLDDHLWFSASYLNDALYNNETHCSTAELMDILKQFTEMKRKKTVLDLPFFIKLFK